MELELLVQKVWQEEQEQDRAVFRKGNSNSEDDGEEPKENGGSGSVLRSTISNTKSTLQQTLSSFAADFSPKIFSPDTQKPQLLGENKT